MTLIICLLFCSILMLFNIAPGSCSCNYEITYVHRGGKLFEGPHWVDDENALYWVDISGQKVLRYDMDSGNVTSRYIGHGPVTLVVRIKGKPKYLLITVKTSISCLNWNSLEDDSALTHVTSVDVGLPDNRCNDGKVDARGRLWFGTMGKESDVDAVKDQGSLYMLDKHNFANPEVKLQPVSISNGIVWSANNKFMFYIDTPTRKIDVFDFDNKCGKIGNRRTLFSFQANNVAGSPDGMTIDTDGNLWVACYNGGQVIKIDSRTGRLLAQVTIPAKKVTSVMFGGRDLSTLFVTTNSVGLTCEELAQQPGAGSLMAIHGLGARGLPQNYFDFSNTVYC